MARLLTCSWCHGENPDTAFYCWFCGHEVGKSRLECRCEQCRPELHVADEEVQNDDA